MIKSHILLMTEIEDKIKDWEDAEDEISREYFSGRRSLRDKIKATWFVEKNIMFLKKRKEEIVNGRNASLLRRMKELNKTYMII